MRIAYFAKVREAIGHDGEERDFPAHVKSISDCLDFLESENAAYQQAFAQREKLRFALDLNMAKLDHEIADAQELAIFPPVTGG